MPSRITPVMVEGEGRALRIATNLPGIVYNMKAAPWVAQVNTTDDLLKPEYKGKFYTTPFLGGFDVLLAPDVWGIEKTTAYHLKPSTIRWHVKHAEMYIKAHAGRRLAEHTPADVETYLQEKGRNGRLADWQFAQVVRALQFLFVESDSSSRHFRFTLK